MKLKGKFYNSLSRIRRGCATAGLLGFWDCGFESRGGTDVCCVVCCQVEASASPLSLGQRSPTDCGVSEYDRKALMMRRLWPTRSCCVFKKNINSKLRFRQHVDYIFSQIVLMLGLIQNVKFSFSVLDCVFLLYLTLIDLNFNKPQAFGILQYPLQAKRWKVSNERS